MNLLEMKTGAASQGLFITFEGSEGCGKSTQIRLLAEFFQSRGHEPLLLREPGGTTAGEVIRHLLKHAPEGEALVPEAELLLFSASRAQLVREVIRPALESGKIVISDRFLDSTTVYQGIARRIPPSETAHINAFAVGGCVPDLTFLLDLDRATALARISKRDESADRIEREPEEFFEAVRKGYLDLATIEPHRIRVLDASGSPGEIARKIQSLLSARVPGGRLTDGPLRFEANREC